MPWATNTAKQKVVPGLTPDAKKKYNDWAKAIGTGKDPKTAAKGWDSDYEVLKTAKVGGKPVKLCSIRLTKEHRVYFAQNDATQICEIHKVGSHDKPTGF